jgi:hypothetical protein
VNAHSTWIIEANSLGRRRVWSRYTSSTHFEFEESGSPSLPKPSPSVRVGASLGTWFPKSMLLGSPVPQLQLSGPYGGKSRIYNLDQNHQSYKTNNKLPNILISGPLTLGSPILGGGNFGWYLVTSQQRSPGRFWYQRGPV